MGRDDRHDGRPHDGASVDAGEAGRGEGIREVDDTLDRVRRLATDTAEMLIVHEEGEAEAGAEPTHSERYLQALRERVDTGEYAVLPGVVAEAMVRKADRLKP